MSQLPNATSRIVAQDNGNCNQFEAILLDAKQWSYLQNRHNLTPRERQIAELVCQGLRNDGIAKHLGITAGTVKTHTRNIYRKVRVKSKIAMLLKFVSDARRLAWQSEESLPLQLQTKQRPPS
jgi:DNA-binding NarL/FixJ family response regulator